MKIRSTLTSLHLVKLVSPTKVGGIPSIDSWLCPKVTVAGQCSWCCLSPCTDIDTSPLVPPILGMLTVRIFGQFSFQFSFQFSIKNESKIKSKIEGSMKMNLHGTFSWKAQFLFPFWVPFFTLGFILRFKFEGIDAPGLDSPAIRSEGSFTWWFVCHLLWLCCGIKHQADCEK